MPLHCMKRREKSACCRLATAPFRACLVGRNLDVQSLHSARFPTVAFRLYLVIIVQPLTN